MRKAILATAIISSLSLFSCGGGGGGGDSTQDTISNITPTTQILTGQFVDAPVAGIDYITSSGITGTTDNNGYFKYKEGDTITFKIGKITLGDAKAGKIITPITLLDEYADNQTLLQDKVSKIVAFLMSLDDDQNDNVIRIKPSVKQALEQIQTEIKDLAQEETKLQEIQIDIDGDTNPDDLYNLVQSNLTQAKQHLEDSIYSTISDYLLEKSGKVLDINGNKCSFSISNNNISFTCDNGTASITKNNGLIQIILPDGTTKTIYRVEDNQICFIDNTGQEQCFNFVDAPQNDQNNNDNKTTDNQVSNTPYDFTNIPSYVQNYYNYVITFFNNKVGKSVSFNSEGITYSCTISGSEPKYTVNCDTIGNMSITVIPKSDYVYFNVNGNEYRGYLISSLSVSWMRGYVIEILH